MKRSGKQRSLPWNFISISRAVPTIQLFDAIWQLVFAWLHGTYQKIEQYLQGTYFAAVKKDHLQRQLRCSSTLWGGLHGSGQEAYRHLPRQFIRDGGVGELPFILAETPWSQDASSTNRSAELDARSVSGGLDQQIPLGWKTWPQPLQT